MFKKIFIDLCNRKGIAPTVACKEVGLSNATFSCWTDESVPRRATLQRIASYFDVSVDYLLGKNEQRTMPARIDELTEHDYILLRAYHAQPEIQPAVDRLLGIEKNGRVLLFKVAKSTEPQEGYVQMEAGRWNEMENTPPTDQDLL